VGCDGGDGVVPFQERLWQLRGRVVSELNVLESMLDEVLMIYFDRRADDDEFRSMVLARISTAQKVDMIDQVLTALGARDRFVSALSWLRKANEYRNDVAHSHIALNTEALRRQLEQGPDLTEREVARLLEWDVVRSSRSGTRRRRADLAELEAWIPRFEQLRHHAVRMIILTASRTIDDTTPLETLRDFDAMNPGIADDVS
jgi:hypothetical protein